MDVINVITNNTNIIFDSDSSYEDDSESDVKKLNGFCEEIVPTFSDELFKLNFRMPISTLQDLCKDIHDLTTRICQPGRDEINVEKQVMIGLWYLRNKETIKSIAGRFGCANSTAWIIIKNFSRKLLQLNIAKSIIHWPTVEERRRTSQYFKQKYRFAGIIGAIDGSHIPIIAPIKHPNSYVCRKGFHSILLQAACNEKLEFIHTYAGECGSIHDSRVLSKSNLPHRIGTGDAQINANEHLLGDSAYSLKPWLLPPFKNVGNLSDGQVTYNIVHSKCRVVIERAFGLLKGRFRRLKYIDTRNPVLAPLYVGASCVLHNYILQKNGEIDVEFINEGDDHEGEIINIEPDDPEFEDEEDDEDLSSNDASIKRMAIVNDLF